MSTGGPPLTVVHCVYSLAMGGQEQVILGLTAGADRSRYAPRVLCLESAGALAPRFAEAGTPVDVLQPRASHGARAAMGAMVQYLRRIRPTILHTHNSGPHQYGAVARAITPVPLLVHTKHGRNQTLSRTGVLLEQFAGWMSDVVVAVSGDAAEWASRRDRVPANRLRIIRNGIDVGTAPVRATPGAGRRAVHVGRLDPVKDQATLLRAARLIADKEPAFRLDIVGDGPVRPELEALAGELGLTEVVRFHGMLSDVRPVLASADLFLLTSVSEGISIALLEAMAMELPIVATDVGGNREVIVPGETGVLVPVGRPDAFADAVLDLFAHPERLADFSIRARARVDQQFSARATVAAYEQLYQELLGEHGRQAAA